MTDPDWGEEAKALARRSLDAHIIAPAIERALRSAFERGRRVGIEEAAKFTSLTLAGVDPRWNILSLPDHIRALAKGKGGGDGG